MKIYHYTTLENLILIIKNKTIRFNRLDKMDDHCEQNFFSIGMNWSPYTYVSCWSDSDEESIPLWHMYAKGCVGIRIGLDENCIDCESVQTFGYRKLDNRIRFAPSKPDSLGIGVQFVPFSIYGDLNNQECLKKIQYIEDFINDQNKNISIGANRIVIPFSLTEDNFKDYIGVYKSSSRSFQNEIRFRLFMIPLLSKDGSISFSKFENVIKNNTLNTIENIDIHLNAEALKNIEITLGPNTTQRTVILVKLLLKEFLSEVDVKNVLRASALNCESWKYLD